MALVLDLEEDHKAAGDNKDHVAVGDDEDHAAANDGHDEHLLAADGGQDDIPFMDDNGYDADYEVG